MSDSNSILEHFDPSHFLEYLRVTKGYSIGIGEHKLINQLLAKFWVYQKSPKTVEELADVLAPVLCKTVLQQHRFIQDLEEWIELNKAVEPPSEEITHTIETTNKATFPKILSWVILAFASILILMLIAEIGVRPSQNLKPIVDNQNPANQLDSDQLLTLSLIIAITFLVIIFSRIILRIWRNRTNLLLKRLKIEFNQAFNLNRFFLHDLGERHIQTLALAHTAKKFNNPLYLESNTIDISNTIQKTLNEGGYFQLVYKWIPQSPEYLILVDQKTYADHQSAYIKNFVNILEDFDVNLDVFYFNGDFRNSYSEKYDTVFSIRDLAKRYHNYQLLIFSAGQDFINPVDREIMQWVNQLSTWKNRTLFTPDGPSPQNSLHQLLHPFFQILPASHEGLERFIMSPHQELTGKDEAAPSLFTLKPLNWISNIALEKDKIEWGIKELKSFLGPTGFDWLCACAIYPELTWKLTLYLGHNLKDPEGKIFYNEKVLVKLIQLPWFRFGKMPDWIRLRLIYELQNTLEKQIREIIFLLFSTASIKPISSFTLEIAQKKRRQIIQFGKDLLKSFQKDSPHSPLLNDHIFVDFLKNRLSVQIPQLPGLVPSMPPKFFLFIFLGLIWVGIAVISIFSFGLIPLIGLFLFRNRAKKVPEQKVESAKQVEAISDHPHDPSTISLRPIFVLEMWERFSYYGFRAILVLFLTATTSSSGLGLVNERALAIYSTYLIGIYLLAIPGGWIADNMLGYRRAILYGGIICTIGYFLLVIPNSTFSFYTGLGVIAIGSGLFKPNITVIVGEKYRQGGTKQEISYLYFYMWLNVGALLGVSIISFFGQNINWQLGFAVAGVGMLIGLVYYLANQKKLGTIGLKAPGKTSHKARENNNLIEVLIRFIIFLFIQFIVLLIFQGLGIIEVFTISGISNSRPVILTLVVLSYFIFIFSNKKFETADRQKLGFLFILILSMAIFWSCFEIAGSSFNQFTQDYVNRTLFNSWEIPSSWLQNVHITLPILLCPVIAFALTRYSKNTFSLNVPIRFGIGLVFLGLGFVLLYMVIQIQNLDSGVRTGPFWLIMTYLLHTIGELFIAPLGLSATHRLAPNGYKGQLMGIWFASTVLSALIAYLYVSNFEVGITEISSDFATVAYISIISGFLFIFISPFLNRLWDSTKPTT